jgi:hypothetical protein
MKHVYRTIKDVRDELKRVDEEIENNEWDDAFTSPSFIHMSLMQDLGKRRSRLQKLLDRHIDRLN